jgi:hypothetical protein
MASWHCRVAHQNRLGELAKAKKDLISNPCFGVDIPVYEGVPSHIKEHTEKINELYNQAQKGLDLYA